MKRDCKFIHFNFHSQKKVFLLSNVYHQLVANNFFAYQRFRYVIINLFNVELVTLAEPTF